MKFLLLFIAFATFNVLLGQQSNYKILNEYSLNADSITSYNMPEQLQAILQDKLVIALGENTHATREYFLKKNEIIKYCVNKLGFKAVIFEADVVASKKIDKYIFKGEGNIDSLLFELGTKAWMTEEVKELLIWLKEFNHMKIDSEKVRFFGMDIQWSVNIVNQLKSRYKVKDFLTQKANSELDLISSGNGKVNMESAKLLVDELKEKSNSYSFVNNNDRVNFLELIRLLDQSINYKATIDIYEKSKKRDYYMASNVIKIVDSLNLKSIVWAHNEHILKTKNSLAIEAMGCKLAAYYLYKYYCIGFFLKEGELGYMDKYTGKIVKQKIPSFNKRKSLDRKLSKLKYENLFINIRSIETKIQGSENIFNYDMITRNIHLVPSRNGKSYRIYNVVKTSRIIDEFDGIIFLNKTTGANPIKFNK
jgi:erythromycin esterase